MAEGKNSTGLSIGNHLRCFKMVDAASAQIHIYITCIFMPLQGELQGEGSTSSELIQVAMCVFEKNYCALADLVFKLVKLFYSYSVYFCEAESKVIFFELQHEYSKNMSIKLEFNFSNMKNTCC